MENISSILSGIICPAFLIFAGIYFSIKLKFFFVLHPLKTLKSVKSALKNGFSSLACALAGTLGVGNMAGVATAIHMGGAGALVWMEIGALCAMSVKYMEVHLAMETRIRTAAGYTGGAWNYIKKISAPAASFFALLCIGNSYLTGNIVQVKAAASALPVSPLYVGIVMGGFALFVAAGGGKRICGFCSGAIPFLCALYLGLCLYIIIINRGMLPQIAMEAIKEAFSVRSAAGGLGGFAMMQAMRYGICRGIFSNEAGCGTSPTAHAMAETEDAHGQSCLGILEVFIDTTLLCTVGGLVILISGVKGADGIGVTLRAFSSLGGELVGKIIAVSIVMFAFSTVISQASYGLAAVSYLTKSGAGEIVYLLGILVSCIIGSVISEGLMWEIADVVLSLMTVINIWYIFRIACGKDRKKL